MRTIEEIEKERKEQRIPKQLLFKTAGVNPETYRRTQKGLTEPNTRTLKKLDDALTTLRLGSGK